MALIHPLAVIQFVKHRGVKGVVSTLDHVLDWETFTGDIVAFPELVTFVQGVRQLHRVKSLPFDEHVKCVALEALSSLFSMYESINVLTQEVQVVCSLFTALTIDPQVVDVLLWCFHDVPVWMLHAHTVEPLYFLNTFCINLIGRLCAVSFRANK